MSGVIILDTTVGKQKKGKWPKNPIFGQFFQFFDQFFLIFGGRPKSITLPALQKHLVNIFFVFGWEFCIEKMAGIFGEFFLVSVSHETKHKKSSKNSGKIRRKIREKIRDENSKNSRNFRSATFLT